MQIYKTRLFEKWADKEGLTDDALCVAVDEMERGLIDVDLGGHMVKKRVALPGRGKRGGSRTLLAYRMGDRAFFVYGYTKNERDNIDGRELQALRRLAVIYLSFDTGQLDKALTDGNLKEVIPCD